VALAAPLVPEIKNTHDKGLADRQKAIDRATAASCLVTVNRLAPATAAPVGGVAPGASPVLGGIAAGSAASAAPPPPPPPPPPPSAAVRVGGSVKAPTQLKYVRPVYPAIARSAGVQGTVIVEATIGTDGHVTAVKVLRSVPLLDQAAIDAVTQWEYSPTVVDGKPVEVIMTATVNFSLQSRR